MAAGEGGKINALWFLHQRFFHQELPGHVADLHSFTSRGAEHLDAACSRIRKHDRSGEGFPAVLISRLESFAVSKDDAGISQRPALFGAGKIEFVYAEQTIEGIKFPMVASIGGMPQA